MYADVQSTTDSHFDAILAGIIALFVSAMGGAWALGNRFSKIESRLTALETTSKLNRRDIKLIANATVPDVNYPDPINLEDDQK